MDIYEVSSIYQWTTVIWFTSNTLPDFQLNIASTGSYYLYFFNKSHLSMSKGLKKKVQIHKGKNSSQGDDSGSQILTNSRKMESRWRRGNWLSIKNRAELQMTMEGNTTEKYAHRHPAVLQRPGWETHWKPGAGWAPVMQPCGSPSTTTSLCPCGESVATKPQTRHRTASQWGGSPHSSECNEGHEVLNPKPSPCTTALKILQTRHEVPPPPHWRILA